MRVSESVTENIFRDFYRDNSPEDAFIEKSTIPNAYGFVSKKGTGQKGYPDFFMDSTLRDFVIIVEAKALTHSDAEEEVKWYMVNNTISKPIIGIAVSGQVLSQIKVTYFYKEVNGEIQKFQVKDKLLTIDNLDKALTKRMSGEIISDEELIKVIKDLNTRFNKNNRVRSTDRSLFFSGLLIALTNNNFRSTYQQIAAPTEQEVSTIGVTVLEAHNLNEAIIVAISKQISSNGKTNSHLLEILTILLQNTRRS